MITRNSRASKRWMVAAVAAVVCGSTLAISGAASAGPGTDAPEADRISGSTRYGTAAEVNSDDDFGIDDTDLVVVNGLAFPDGLAASVFGDAILLTEADTIPADTLAELERVATDNESDDDEADGIDSIKVIGGTSAVSSAVYEELSDLAEGRIERVSGPSRYETAVDVGETFIDEDECFENRVIIATGTDFPDALAAGPLAWERCAPILLNTGPSLLPVNQEFLEDEGISHAFIVGGTTAVPASVETQLNGALGIETLRLAGDNRDATAVAIAEELIDGDTLGFGDGDLDYGLGVVAVNRLDFPDALAAGPFAVNGFLANDEDLYSTIQLVGTDSIAPATAQFHVENCDTIEQIFAVGGTSVISNAVVAGAVDAATCSEPDIVSAEATLSNLTAREVAVTGGSDETTLTAVGPALGGVGNFAFIIFESDPDANEQGAVVNLEDEDYCVPTGPTTEFCFPTITYTDNFGSLLESNFEDNWNESAAGAFFEADAGDGTFVGVPDSIGPSSTTFPGLPGDLFVTDDIETGTFDLEVVVTFDRLVQAGGSDPAVAPEVDIWDNSNSDTDLSNVILDFGDVADVDPSDANYDEDGETVVTYTWEDEVGEQPGAFDSARIAGETAADLCDGGLEDSVSGLQNCDQVIQTLSFTS